MKLKEIITQIKDVYEGEPWYGNSLSTFFEKLRQKDLSLSIGNGHSIGQIIEHMITWRQFVIDKLNGKVENIEVGSSIDWSPKRDLNLFELKNIFHSTQNKLLNILSNKDDTLLDQQVPGKNYSFETILNGIIQHDIYHLGQVFLLYSSLKKH